MKSGWPFLALNILGYGLWGFAAKIAQNKGASSPMLSTLTTTGMVIVTLLVFVPQLSVAQLGLDKSYLLPGLAAGVFVGLGNLFLYKSIETIPFSIAYPASGLYILLTVILAVLFLKEQLTVNRCIGIACSMLAVFFLSK
jgi:drug/metabolite transporter (DMT)-like permease